MTNYSVETTHRVYDDSEGVCIEFRDWPEMVGCGLIQMHTPDSASQEFYGEVSIAMTIEHAKAFVKVLNKQIEAMEDLA